MTKKTETVANDYVASVQETIEKVQKQVEVPAAVRDFVKNAAKTGKERAGEMQTGAYKATEGAEKFAADFVSGYAGFVRGMIAATHENIEHTFSTVEKIAAAKTPKEALQLQADFVKDNARANYERVREAAETARVAFADNTKAFQDEVSKLYGKKAA